MFTSECSAVLNCSKFVNYLAGCQVLASPLGLATRAILSQHGISVSRHSNLKNVSLCQPFPPDQTYCKCVCTTWNSLFSHLEIYQKGIARPVNILYKIKKEHLQFHLFNDQFSQYIAYSDTPTRVTISTIPRFNSTYWISKAFTNHPIFSLKLQNKHYFLNIILLRGPLNLVPRKYSEWSIGCK